MRNCLRCQAPMNEEMEPITTEGMWIYVKKVGKWRASGKLKCAVCLECGYTELYVKNTEKLKKR